MGEAGFEEKGRETISAGKAMPKSNGPRHSQV